MPNRWMTALLLALLASYAGAQTTQEAQYLAAITQRAQKHVDALRLEDVEKANRVRDIIVAQYQALRANHAVRDQIKQLKDDAAGLKSAQEQSLKGLHNLFLTALSAELSDEQVDTIKNEMTYNKVNVDYNAFCDMLPDLTDEQKAYIKSQLIEARELAMDGGSSDEKHAIFGKYRGRINNYLSKQGYDLKQASKDWAERRKARQAAEKQAGTTRQD